MMLPTARPRRFAETYLSLELSATALTLKYGYHKVLHGSGDSSPELTACAVDCLMLLHAGWRVG